jgi:hypothetical protein
MCFLNVKSWLLYEIVMLRMKPGRQVVARDREREQSLR